MHCSGYEKNEILDSQASDTQVVAKLTGNSESDGHESDGYESVHDRWHELAKQQLEMCSDGVEPESGHSLWCTDDEDREDIGE